MLAMPCPCRPSRAVLSQNLMPSKERKGRSSQRGAHLLIDAVWVGPSRQKGGHCRLISLSRRAQQLRTAASNLGRARLQVQTHLLC